MPMAPPPPALLTSTTGTPRLAASAGWSRRMAVSVGPPGANGMMNSTGRVGYDCASAPAIGPPAASAARASARDRSHVIGSFLLVNEWKRPGAHLNGRAAERVPLLKACPDVLARGLGLAAERVEVDAGDPSIAHAHDAVHDHGLDVVADPALHQALDRVAHGAPAQRAAAGGIDDHEIGLGAGDEPAEGVAAPRA